MITLARTFKPITLGLASLVLGGVIAGAGFASTASAVEASNSAASNSTNSNSTGNDTQRLQNIISRGDKEIARRLATLNTLDGKIAAATKLSASDKSALTAEVNAEITGLTSLKAKLDADTDLATARTDAQSIFTEYRVYALIAPKVGLIKAADDQQVVQGKLTALIQKLQTRIDAAKQAGKNTGGLQTALDNVKNVLANAQSISSSVESKVLALQPSDYNSDHTVMSAYSAQLKTAHTDNETAYSDVKQIVADLKNS